MNKTKLSNPVRSIAFFLTAIILACTFGFTVDGWQMANDGIDNNTNPPEDENSASGDITDNPDTDEQEQMPEEPEIYIPEYTSRLTGLEISEETKNAVMLAFVMSSGLPTYGIYAAEMICEIPTENGGSRIVAFIPENENLWKIGSITQTRGYISNIAKYFGASIVSYGNDDSMDYNKCDLSNNIVDFSLLNGYHFSEQAGNIYTNRDLLMSAVADANIGNNAINKSPLPFTHIDYLEEKIVYSGTATSIRIPDGCLADELRFDSESENYLLYKNGVAVVDMSNEDAASFTNCFVLFADSVIYDNSNGNTMVMDTIGDGRGLYFTNGSYTEIRWTATAGGIMTFYTTDGLKLTVNRGRNYITFVRSSKAENIIIQ